MATSGVAIPGRRLMSMNALLTLVFILLNYYYNLLTRYGGHTCLEKNGALSRRVSCEPSTNALSAVPNVARNSSENETTERDIAVFCYPSCV